MNFLTAIMKPLHTFTALLATLALGCLAACAQEGDFKTIFDGESLKGWNVSEENPNTWRIEDGALVTRGPRSHLFLDVGDRPLRNFHFMAEVMTEPGSNGGIFFHTAYQASGWPSQGFESQVNVTHKDWRKTGSLYAVADLGHTPAQDGQWWTQEIIVEGKKVTMKIDGITVLVYQEPAGAQPGDRFGRVFGQGTIALQAHDPDSIVRYRNLRLKRLP